MLDYFEPGDSPDFCMRLNLLEAGEACDGPDAWCGPDRRCVTRPGGGHSCQEVCRFSEGAVDTTGHPDCSDPAATCRAQESLWGVCIL